MTRQQPDHKEGTESAESCLKIENLSLVPRAATLGTKLAQYVNRVTGCQEVVTRDDTRRELVTFTRVVSEKRESLSDPEGQRGPLRLVIDRGVAGGRPHMNELYVPRAARVDPKPGHARAIRPGGAMCGAVARNDQLVGVRGPESTVAAVPLEAGRARTSE